jgi:hypothetical protein
LLFNAIKRQIDNSVRPFTVFYDDYKNNRRYANSEIKFLVVRHGRYKPRRYDIILDWIAANLPEIRPYFELHQLPCRITDWSKYRLHLPWLQDPVQQWSMRAYNQACRISRQCDALNIPVINRVENLVNASKSNGASIIGSTGIRTPRIVKITDFENFKKDLGGLELPFIIRDDWGHQGTMLLIENLRQLDNISLKEFSHPVAIEFINTQSNDGLYRKYRFVVAGDIGIPLSMHVRKIWEVRGSQSEKSEALFNEEINYLSQPDPNHDALLKACQVLKLDFVAFDYSYDQDGKLTVWEANPYPYLHISRKREHRKLATEKTLAAITRMHLKKAGLPINPVLEKIL